MRQVSKWFSYKPYQITRFSPETTIDLDKEGTIRELYHLYDTRTFRYTCLVTILECSKHPALVDLELGT